MNSIGLDVLMSEVRAIAPVRPVGRVIAIKSGTITVAGLSDVAALGDLVWLNETAERPVQGEIISLSTEEALVLPNGQVDGLQIGDRVVMTPQQGVAPHSSWIGRVIDPYGNALDDGPILRGPKIYPLRGAPINPTERRGLGARLETGMKVFNTLLPLVRGQRIGLFSGSGIGKSTLLARFALGVQADVVVIALIGERGREVREFVERVLGAEGMQRSVVIAATSDTAPMVRRRCAWTAMAVAEHFRDEGKQVLLLADSVTRFADAHREIALAAGEAAGLRGYPPSTMPLITALCERAGPGTDQTGDITAVFSVLVAGSDMEEPVADTLRGVLDGHVVLDRKIAERGRFPAIDLLRSVSRSLPGAATEPENAIISSARSLLGTYDRSEMMVQAGLYTMGTDANIDAAIAAFPKLDTFITMREDVGITASFQSLAQCVGD
ncbi:Flagellum-specific ATP synthase FliI [Candidatus Rhodobacter oscarellae]|uniref:Flagellum-specific ATP synthase FliI n=1 Tax=Candidatus Rhodobacter oscarellae TaxID=1675527 RepID=A0A0J9E8V6_9RHOB|nr:FliI/YscN family ATPase [Candidatus Rhodobacter lobularis]KMW59215.1 Flagellum-specific ATP synthase FliI [Candidatus Rhodobacter lobularis]